MFGKEADVFLKRLSMKLAEKRHRPYSQTVSFLKLVLLFIWSVQIIDVYVVQEFRPVEFRIVIIGKTEQDQSFIPPWNNVEVDCQVLIPFSPFLLCSSFLEIMKITLNVT